MIIVSQLTRQQAIDLGYRITSRKYRRASRIDHPDWKKVLIYQGIVAHNDLQAADFYRRVLSHDRIVIPEEWMPGFPNSTYVI